MTTIEFEAYPVLPYWTKVRGPLFDCMKALETRIDRERRAELEARAKGMRMWLLSHLRVARQTYEVVEALMRDRKELALGFGAAVAIPPLARVILESMLSIAFVFEKPATRLPWFWKATWREIADWETELTAEYGGKPEWADWLKGLAERKDSWRDLLDEQGTPLSTAELASPRSIDYWPTPGQMRRQTDDATRKAFISYFVSNYYGDLSAASHLSATGMLAQGGILLSDQPEPLMKKYFSDQVLTSLTLLFSLNSELVIDAVPDPGLARTAIGLWQTPNLWGHAQEAYVRCFEAPLKAIAGD